MACQDYNLLANKEVMMSGYWGNQAQARRGQDKKVWMVVGKGTVKLYVREIWAIVTSLQQEYTASHWS